MERSIKGLKSSPPKNIITPLFCIKNHSKQSHNSLISKLQQGLTHSALVIVKVWNVNNGLIWAKTSGSMNNQGQF